MKKLNVKGKKIQLSTWKKKITKQK